MCEKTEGEFILNVRTGAGLGDILSFGLEKARGL